MDLCFSFFPLFLAPPFFCSSSSLCLLHFSFKLPILSLRNSSVHTQGMCTLAVVHGWQRVHHIGGHWWPHKHINTHKHSINATSQSPRQHAFVPLESKGAMESMVTHTHTHTHGRRCDTVKWSEGKSEECMQVMVEARVATQWPHTTPHCHTSGHVCAGATTPHWCLISLQQKVQKSVNQKSESLMNAFFVSSFLRLLTSQIEFSECCVWFQHFTQYLCSCFCNIIICERERKKKWIVDGCLLCVFFLLSSRVRLSLVSAVFDFNDSLNDVAPTFPM